MYLKNNGLLLFTVFLSFCTMNILGQNQVEELVEDTTTPEDPTSTTEITTTTAETTTTTEPATTKATTPVPPAPSSAGYYNITENNITCIMIDADFNFLVTYDIGMNKTNQTTIHVPTPKDKILVKVDGSCNSTEGTQYIELTWGTSIPKNSLTIKFNQSEDGKTWHILEFSSVLYMDKDGGFQNASSEGKTLYSVMDFDLTPAEIAVNHSFLCFAKLEVENATTTMENKPYMYPVSLSIDGMQFQAYNHIADQNKFVDEVHCEADKIADVVPIAVGCALAALILIVLTAYIVGRRRRSAAYQSV